MLDCSSLSTSTVATSKASVYSVPLDEILSASGWSSASTFAKLYNYPVDFDIDIAETFETCRLGDYCVKLTLLGSFSTAHMVSALKTEFAQAQCYLMQSLNAW